MLVGSFHGNTEDTQTKRITNADNISFILIIRKRVIRKKGIRENGFGETAFGKMVIQGNDHSGKWIRKLTRYLRKSHGADS